MMENSAFKSIAMAYDGSFEGLCTCVFESFKLKLEPAYIIEPDQETPMFAERLHIISDQNKSLRVKNALKKKVSENFFLDMNKTFQPHIPKIVVILFKAMKNIITSVANIENNFADPEINEIHRISRLVDKEAHRMMAFIRFVKTTDGIFYAKISPAYNVIPQLIDHFVNRYADQEWVIYDVVRKQGLCYDKKQLIIKTNGFCVSFDKASGNDPYEKHYQNLWKGYLYSVNISERKNTRLQLQHMPKKYWKYLNEKQ
jgi:probable DNA metabolism protein